MMTWLKCVTLWKQSIMCVVWQFEETTSILLFFPVGRGAKFVRLMCHSKFAFYTLYANVLFLMLGAKGTPTLWLGANISMYSSNGRFYNVMYNSYVWIVYRGKRSCQSWDLVLYASGEPVLLLQHSFIMDYKHISACPQSVLNFVLASIPSPSSKGEHKTNRTTPRMTFFMNL